ncbi:hypothetical protein M0802_001138 [Mischocyttarus mexicanus]|nr:hypothetical protein M0802_001138 [Mischocyttarus mexicanus]
MEEVTKCSYINCRDIREKEQIFHELPVSDIDLCIQWLINSGHEHLINHDFLTLRSMKFFICSNHFKSDSYLAKGTLKENAIPQPYWHYDKRINDLSHVEPESKLNQIIAKTRKHHAHVYQFKDQNGNTENNNIHEERWCRTCATKRSNVVNMTLKKRNTEMSLLSKLKLLIEIDDEDTLPLNMCYDCVKKLEQSFQFFQQIYIADNTLRHIFPKDQLDNDCYGITIDRIDGSVSDIEFDPILQSNEDDRLLIKSKLLDAKGNERSLFKKVSTKEKFLEDTSTSDKYGTVFSLLTDTCHSDEELHWADVLNALERQKIARFKQKVFSRKTKIYCEFCTSKFTLRRQLKTHMVNNHSKEVRTTCMDCIMYFEDELLLLEHRAVVHNDDQLHRCDYCQKCFTRKRGLRLHITRSHARKKSYSCDFCQEKFISKQYLTLHIESGPPCINIKKEKKPKEKTKNVSAINFEINTNQSNGLKTSLIEEQKIVDTSINKDYNHTELSSTSCHNNESQSMHLDNTVHSVIDNLMES